MSDDSRIALLRLPGGWTRLLIVCVIGLSAFLIYLLPHANLIGALLVFRFIYFLVPLCLGGMLLFASEIARRPRAGLRT